MPLHQMAALCAFWDLDRVTLDKIAKQLKAKFAGGSDLHQLLWAMVKQITKLSDAEVLKILFKRLATMETKQQWGQELLCLDEAMDVLEESDKRVLIEEQKKVPPNADCFS